jgi:hypothetical protein
VPPAFATANAGDNPFTYREVAGQARDIAARSGVLPSDRQDLIVRELGIRRFLASSGVSMTNFVSGIFGDGGPPQIMKMIVGPPAVEMCNDMRAGRLRAVEGSAHQHMSAEGATLATGCSQPVSNVAVFIRYAGKE